MYHECSDFGLSSRIRKRDFQPTTHAPRVQKDHDTYVHSRRDIKCQRRDGKSLDSQHTHTHSQTHNLHTHSHRHTFTLTHSLTHALSSLFRFLLTLTHTSRIPDLWLTNGLPALRRHASSFPPPSSSPPQTTIHGDPPSLQCTRHDVTH